MSGPVNITIEVEGMSATLAALDKVERGVLDLRQLGTWKWVQSEFFKIEKELFASEGASGQSGKWKELSSPYKEIKAKKWGNKPILQASGDMYKSLTATGGDNVYEESPLELTLGTKDPKAGYHQRGGGRLPQRRAIDMTNEQVKQLVKPIQTKLEQLIDNAKLRDVRGF